MPLGFGDARIVALIERAGAYILYSSDRGFERFSWITRRKPSRSPGPRS